MPASHLASGGALTPTKKPQIIFAKFFSRYTSRIEPLSLDEAYLDVTDSVHCHGSATLIAEEIRQTIFNELQLTASAGVAPVKFLAKIASDMNKPNGQFVITPAEVPAFLQTLPLAKNPPASAKSRQQNWKRWGYEPAVMYKSVIW